MKKYERFIGTLHGVWRLEDAVRTHGRMGKYQQQSWITYKAKCTQCGVQKDITYNSIMLGQIIRCNCEFREKE